MTTLTITPDVAKKKMRLDGVIAAGEKVAVTVNGFGDKSTTETRLRVYCGRELIAIFPKDEPKSGETNTWTQAGGDLTCELDLFTVQAEKATRCGCAECLFILDDLSAKVLYATKDKEILKWIKRGGNDIPIDLSGYKDILADVNERINEFETEMRGEWNAYKSDIYNAWNTYKNEMTAYYNQFTTTVTGLVEDKATKAELLEHVNDKDNPHEVKIAQIPQLRSELDNLDSRITQEATARDNSDIALRESIMAERDRAVGAENALHGEIVSENKRAVSVETQLDLDIRKLGNRMPDIVRHILGGKTYARPTSARGWYELICELISFFGGNIATEGIVPGTKPSEITLTADDGTARSLSIVKNELGEYTSIVR